jgi:nuclear factor I
MKFHVLNCILLIVSASIMQGPNGMQPPVNTIKLENPGYYCSSYTPPAPEHASMMASGAYSK